MNLRGRSVRTWQADPRSRPRHAPRARLVVIAEHPGLLSAMATGAAESSPRASIDILALCLSRAFMVALSGDAFVAPVPRLWDRHATLKGGATSMFKKDVKMEGTN
jgi:hypothetical protein